MDEQEKPYTEIALTAESVKVLAHPLRSRLLSALRRGGPSSATALAAALGTNSGATSYHLRRLADVGLVADTGEGRGKERLWAASTQSHSWTASAFAADEDARTALGWLTRDYVRALAERFSHWLDVADAWPGAWQDAIGFSDVWVEVTPEQLTAMREEMHAVAVRYRDAGAGDPRARRISMSLVSRPLDLEEEPPAPEGAR